VQPMKPMKPMQPLEEMQPLAHDARWWPEEFGTPSSVGSQNDVRYAFFAHKRRLVIERKRELAIYDSAGYDINGVAQSNAEHAISFTTNGHDVPLDSLARLA
jgi:hypothetical protein